MYVFNIRIYRIYLYVYIYTYYISQQSKCSRRMNVCKYIHISCIHTYMYIHISNNVYIHTCVVYIYLHVYTHIIHVYTRIISYKSRSRCETHEAREFVQVIVLYITVHPIFIMYVFTYTYVVYTHVYIYTQITKYTSRSIWNEWGGRACARNCIISTLEMYVNLCIYMRINRICIYIYICIYISHDTPVEVFETHECRSVHTYIVYIYLYTSHILTWYSS